MRVILIQLAQWDSRIAGVGWLLAMAADNLAHRTLRRKSRHGAETYDLLVMVIRHHPLTEVRLCIVSFSSQLALCRFCDALNELIDIR